MYYCTYIIFCLYRALTLLYIIRIVSSLLLRVAHNRLLAVLQRAVLREGVQPERLSGVRGQARHGLHLPASATCQDLPPRPGVRQGYGQYETHHEI